MSIYNLSNYNVVDVVIHAYMQIHIYLCIQIYTLCKLRTFIFLCLQKTYKKQSHINLKEKPHYITGDRNNTVYFLCSSLK